MKKSVLLLVFVLICIVGNSQIIKLKASHYSTKVKMNEYVWDKWDDWKVSGVLITIDTDEERVVIYSSSRQIFDIIENEGTYIDDDGDQTLSLYCLDQNGGKCRLRLMKLYSNNNVNQLYVDYNDFRIVYIVEFLN